MYLLVKSSMLFCQYSETINRNNIFELKSPKRESPTLTAKPRWLNNFKEIYNNLKSVMPCKI